MVGGTSARSAAPLRTCAPARLILAASRRPAATGSPQVTPALVRRLAVYAVLIAFQNLASRGQISPKTGVTSAEPARYEPAQRARSSANGDASQRRSRLRLIVGSLWAWPLNKRALRQSTGPEGRPLASLPQEQDARATRVHPPAHRWTSAVSSRGWHPASCRRLSLPLDTRGDC
jgi:hypothetical protein